MAKRTFFQNLKSAFAEENLYLYQQYRISMNMSYYRSPFFLFGGLLLLTLKITRGEIHTIDKLPMDSNNHLESNWLLHTGGQCGDVLVTVWKDGFAFRTVELMSIEFARGVFNLSYGNCAALCLDRGTPMSYLIYPLENKVLIIDDDEVSVDKVREWVRSCQKSFVGILNYHKSKNPIDIYWLNKWHESGSIWEYSQSIHSQSIHQGLYISARITFLECFLGFRLNAFDSVTSDFIATFTVEHNSIWNVGIRDIPYHYNHSQEDILKQFDHYLQMSNDVKLTFTELGFSKSRVPADIMGSMLTYYYNVKDDCFLQDYGLAYILYDNDPILCPIPMEVQDPWLDRLIVMEEQWLGGRIKLKKSPIYGLRIYQEGFRFKVHSDALNVGMIINFDQVDMREPWMLQIYDHAHRLHEIDMQPGDLVYFESRRCFHGRMKALQGKYYASLFIHFIPADGENVDWTKPDPEAPLPLLDLQGKCYEVENGTTHCDTPVVLPTLSPSGNVVKSGQDLLDYWNSLASEKESATGREEPLSQEATLHSDL